MPARQSLPDPPVPGHRNGCTAAHFKDTPTTRLVAEVRRLWHQYLNDELIASEMAKGHYTLNTFLVALHERADRSVFEASAELIRSARPRDRMQGLRILLELGDQRKRPIFRETWALLEGLLEWETNPRVIHLALHCLGRTLKRRGFKTILRFLNHPSSWVRYAVSNTVLACAPSLSSRPAIAALIQLAEDRDAEVRWSALYEIREHITADVPSITSMLERRCKDRVPRVSQLAREALDLRRRAALPTPEGRPTRVCSR